MPPFIALPHVFLSPRRSEKRKTGRLPSRPVANTTSQGAVFYFIIGDGNNVSPPPPLGTRVPCSPSQSRRTGSLGPASPLLALTSTVLTSGYDSSVQLSSCSSSHNFACIDQTRFETFRLRLSPSWHRGLRGWHMALLVRSRSFHCGTRDHRRARLGLYLAIDQDRPTSSPNPHISHSS